MARKVRVRVAADAGNTGFPICARVALPPLEGTLLLCRR